MSVWTDPNFAFPLADKEKQSQALLIVPGLVFEQWLTPRGNEVGMLLCSSFPSPVAVMRDPQFAFYSFKSDWFLPEALEAPACYTTLRKALEAAGKHLNPAEDRQYKQKPKPKPSPVVPPKPLSEEDFGRKGDVTATRTVFSDGSTVYSFQCPDRWEGEVKLRQSGEREKILTLISQPKNMQLCANWSSSVALHRYLAHAKPSELFKN